MKITKLKIKNCKRGYAVLELLFYISFFAVLSIVVIDSMIIMTRAFRETALQADLSQSGSIIERMSREIRASYDMSLISESNLRLNTKDNSGTDKTLNFSLIGSDVQFLENDVFIGNLNTPNMAVTYLSFTQVITGKGKAVKIVLTVKSANDALNRTQNFYDTIVLRGSY